MKIILDDPAGPNVITKVLLRGRQDGQSQKERSEDATKLALKIGEGAMSQGMQWPLE